MVNKLWTGALIDVASAALANDTASTGFFFRVGPERRGQWTNRPIPSVDRATEFDLNSWKLKPELDRLQIHLLFFCMPKVEIDCNYQFAIAYLASFADDLPPQCEVEETEQVFLLWLICNRSDLSISLGDFESVSARVHTQLATPGGTIQFEHPEEAEP